MASVSSVAFFSHQRQRRRLLPNLLPNTGKRTFPPPPEPYITNGVNMKNFLLTISLSLIVLLGMQSCQKEVPQSEVIKEITIDTTILAGSDYLLNLAPYGNEDAIATILEKGNHFSISELENETDMFSSVYHYASSLKNSGADKVVLSISENPEGKTNCSKDSTIIYINFTIK